MCAFKGRVESDIYSLSNQDSENLPMNNVFSELQHEEELDYKEVAQNSTAHKQAAIPLVLKTNQKRKYPSWDESSKELVDFKNINGHTNVPRGSGPLGRWVDTQRQAFRLLKEGKHSPLTNERRKQLEGIGFTFICGPARPPWDQRFQELVNFKKINGHTNVPKSSGLLWNWVSTQQQAFRLLKEGKDTPLTIDRREKLEGIGFVFICKPAHFDLHWDQRFEELVDFKKINGHANVPRGSGPLGRWVSTQQQAFRLLKEEKASPLIIDRREKLEGIGFIFTCKPAYFDLYWDQRFEELVEFKKINGHANVPKSSGPLWNWVQRQQHAFRLLKEGKHSPLNNARGKKLESIGFVCPPSTGPLC
jgi:hypothetical protein